METDNGRQIIDSVLEGLQADVERERGREDRDAWSAGYVYGLRHAIRVFEVAKQPPFVVTPHAPTSSQTEN